MKYYRLAALTLLCCATLTACTSGSKDPSGAVSGTIHAQVSGATPSSAPAVLYVMLRDATPGAATTAPIAVRKYLPPFQFPMEFSISHHDALVPGMALPEKLQLSARIAVQGSATPIRPEDWVSGVQPMAVERGTRGVKLQLTRQ